MGTISVHPPAFLGRYRAAIDQQVKALLEREPAGLYEMLRYHFGWVDAAGRPSPHALGKALRPALCLLACEAVGGTWERSLPAAAALELLHNFSLIHDDIQDGDEWRHHRPTAWAVWGQAQAINAGDAAFALSGVACEQLREQGYSDATALYVWQLLNTAVLWMIEGQYLDLAFEQRTDITVDDYLALIARKTGALIEVAAHVGALLGTADTALIDHLCLYARALGVAFQIKDDLLGIWGRPEETGKRALADLYRGKKTLPVIYLLENITPSERCLLHHFSGHDAAQLAGEEEVAAVFAVFERSCVWERTVETLAQYCTAARMQLEQSGLPREARSQFAEVVDWLANAKLP